MSGRVRVTLADGRRVTGFRKTLATRSRTPAHLLPDWTLRFVPAMTLSSVLMIAGPFPGLVGVRITELSGIEARGKRKSFVIDQACEAWTRMCGDGPARRATGVLARDDEPGPTLSGPVRRGMSVAIALEFDGRRTRMVTASAMAA